MSTTSWVVEPAGPLKTADRRPLPSSGLEKPFARLSPTGKFRVDVGGTGPTDGPTATNPSDVCCVTVTFPVTATADEGIPPIPATCHARGTPVAKAPDSPVPSRVSRTRSGDGPLSALYVSPLASGRK